MTDEQAQKIFHSEHCNISKDLAGILYRAIEAAVLEAQKQEPEPEWWYAKINNEWDSFTREKPPKDAYDAGTLQPLYAAPVVQPGMVMVPREPTEAMRIAAMNALVSKDDWPTSVYQAMIAAAEGKK